MDRPAPLIGAELPPPPLPRARSPLSPPPVPPLHPIQILRVLTSPSPPPPASSAPLRWARPPSVSQADAPGGRKGGGGASWPSTDHGHLQDLGGGVCVCVWGGWSTFSQKGVKEGGREWLSPKEPGGVRFLFTLGDTHPHTHTPTNVSFT